MKLLGTAVKWYVCTVCTYNIITTAIITPVVHRRRTITAAARHVLKVLPIFDIGYVP